MRASIISNTIVAVLVHVLVLSVVWIGFPVPIPRSNVAFYYSGPVVSGLAASGAAGAPKSAFQPVTVSTPEGAFFKPWTEMRDLDKPKI